MTAALLDADLGSWHAHAHVDKFSPQLMAQVLGDLPDLGRKSRKPGPLGLFVPRPQRIELADLVAAGITPDGTADAERNLLCNAGIQRMLDLLIGAGGQALNNTHCRIGVGDATTAAAASDTDLGAVAGSTHRWFNMADSTYPSRSGQVLTVVSTFASADGNFTAGWQEWCIDAGTASSNATTAPLLNHKIASLGTKVSGAVWAFTVTITIS